MDVFSKSSHHRCSLKKAIIKIFRTFTGKHLCRKLFCRSLGLQLYSKDTPRQMFSCEYYKAFKNTYFEEHLQTAASVFSR